MNTCKFCNNQAVYFVHIKCFNLITPPLYEVCGEHKNNEVPEVNYQKMWIDTWQDLGIDLDTDYHVFLMTEKEHKDFYWI